MLVALAVGGLARADSPCAEAPHMPAPPAGAARVVAGTGEDDAPRLQQALDAVRPGGALVFQPGSYRIGKHLVARVAAVSLFGGGATLHSTSPTDGGLMIQADQVAVYGLTLTQDSNARQSTPWAGGIAVYGDAAAGHARVVGSIIQGNTIDAAAAAGIFLYKASGFTVAQNRVHRSWADGIHMTAGSRDGRVIHNVVTENGDDMIAVVSYAAGRPGPAPAGLKYQHWEAQQDELDRNIYIGRNEVSGNYWGRGITVVGGHDVTIESNLIAKTAVAAGVYLTRETSYSTFGVHNVLLRGNTIRDVETEPPAYTPPGYHLEITHQAAIEIGAQMADDERDDPRLYDAFTVTDIDIVDNRITDARFGALRIGIFSPDASIRRIAVQGNVLADIGADDIVTRYPGLDGATLICRGNSLNGVSWGDQCNKAVPAVTQHYPISGASLRCGSNARSR